jgi:hypothetical protein
MPNYTRPKHLTTLGLRFLSVSVSKCGIVPCYPVRHHGIWSVGSSALLFLLLAVFEPRDQKNEGQLGTSQAGDYDLLASKISILDDLPR